MTGTGTTPWGASGAAATSISMLCWPEARGSSTVHTRAVLALALLLSLIIYLGYLLTSYRMFTMLVTVLSINTKRRECCFFQILSGECCETKLFPTSTLLEPSIPRCHCTWMASFGHFNISFPTNRSMENSFIPSFISKDFMQKHLQLHNVLMFICFKIYQKSLKKYAG